MIALFFEGGELKLGADAKEFERVDKTGGKLNLSHEKAKKLRSVLDMKIAAWDAVERLENGKSEDEEADLLLAQGCMGDTEI